VADAKDVKRYLLERLQAHEDNIETLYDEYATRNAILAGLRDLADNPQIKKDDAIVIFFAGHGSSAKAPDDWQTENGEIQLLVPQDFNDSGEVREEQERIPDRTICAMLEMIAAKKGNNLVSREVWLVPIRFGDQECPKFCDQDRKIWAFC